MAPMKLDAPTLFICSMLIEAAFAALLLLLWRVRRAEPTLLLWSIGSLCGALACVAIALRGHIPDAVSIALGNALLVAAWTLRWAGLRSFNRQRGSPLGVLWPPLAVGLLFLFHQELQLDFSDRVLIVSLVVGGLLLVCCRDIWHAQRHEHLAMRRVALVFLSLDALYHLFRTVLALSDLLAAPSMLAADQTYAVMLMVILILEMGIQISCVMMVFERQESRLQRAVSLDELTGLLNRGGFLPLAQRLCERDARAGLPTCVLLMDLDRFKQINDRWGHDAGDTVLRAFAHCARATLRPADLVARSGGEEFWGLLPSTDPAGATLAAQRLCEHFSRMDVHWQHGVLRNTLSIGVAQIRPGEPLRSALARADAALYQAKLQGRNRVVMHQDLGQKGVVVAA